MYTVLLVDDEMPALRFMQAIIEKYASEFSVVECASSAEAALAYLRSNRVDLLLTDISMPGMNGIELSKEARALHEDIHIVIVSGYAEFEYAKGAIQAAVDDYILKPVSIPHMTEVLDKLTKRLHEENSAKEPALLSALLSNQPYSQKLAARLYGNDAYYFAYVRWGNLNPSQGDLYITSAIPLTDMPFSALYGRDEDEQILFAPASSPSIDFQSAVKAYAAQRKSATWTIIFSRSSDIFTALSSFFHRASQLMERTVVIGRRQFAFLPGTSAPADAPRIPGTTLKRLELFIHDANAKMVKDTFISLAVDWEQRQIPQLYVTTMVQQLIHMVMAAKPALSTQQDIIFRSSKELLRYAVSYGELMAGLYLTLFDDSAIKDKKLSGEELYAYAVRYIQEKHAQPISIQHVCADIGISQTYLSRLFRKHGNTSFNVYLTKCRMDNAMIMIRDHPDIPLRNVASCVGYDDYAYFSKVFHQAVGCAPSQWASALTKEQNIP